MARSRRQARLVLAAARELARRREQEDAHPHLARLGRAAAVRRGRRRRLDARVAPLAVDAVGAADLAAAAERPDHAGDDPVDRRPGRAGERECARD